MHLTAWGLLLLLSLIIRTRYTFNWFCIILLHWKQPGILFFKVIIWNKGFFWLRHFWIEDLVSWLNFIWIIRIIILLGIWIIIWISSHYFIILALSSRWIKPHRYKFYPPRNIFWFILLSRWWLMSLVFKSVREIFRTGFSNIILIKLALRKFRYLWSIRHSRSDRKIIKFIIVIIRLYFGSFGWIFLKKWAVDTTTLYGMLFLFLESIIIIITKIWFSHHFYIFILIFFATWLRSYSVRIGRRGRRGWGWSFRRGRFI